MTSCPVFPPLFPSSLSPHKKNYYKTLSFPLPYRLYYHYPSHHIYSIVRIPGPQIIIPHSLPPINIQTKSKKQKTSRQKMCLISSRDDDYPPARQVHVYRDGRVSRDYVSSPRRSSYLSTSTLGGRRTSTTHVRHVYHSSPRASLVGYGGAPPMTVLDRSVVRRGYY